MEKKSHLVDKVTYFKYLYYRKKKNPANTTIYGKVKNNVEIIKSPIISILSFGPVILNSLILKDVLTVQFWPWRTNKNKHMDFTEWSSRLLRP